MGQSQGNRHRGVGSMIDYIKDMLVAGKITTLPYKMTGPIAIASRNGHYLRCPAWGTDKTIIKYDENYVYVKSDIVGKIDLFDKEGVKVKEINEDELK